MDGLRRARVDEVVDGGTHLGRDKVTQQAWETV